MNSPQITDRIVAPILVSVVIPTKGRSGIVPRAVKSALGQSLRNLEVIVVLDGEDPDTIAALRPLTDSRLRIVSLPKPVGGAEARNIGIQSAQGHWIALLDDDDEWFPQKLERQIARANLATVQFPVVCSAYIARSAERDSPFGRRAPLPGEPVSEYMFCRRSFRYGENALATSVLLVPRALMISVPFDPNLRRHQDWDWALRALNAAGTGLYYIPEQLSIYYMADGVARLSGQDVWKESLAWCRDRKVLLTPKAMSFFIATECITRARQADANWKDICSLLIAFWREGQPTFRSTLLALGYLIASKRLRRLLLRWRS
jgi:glycosyltransferase involved in cell wall biosynthesis